MQKKPFEWGLFASRILDSKLADFKGLAIGFDVLIGEAMNKMKTHKGTKKR